jgi:hypothetical protein
MGAGSGCVVFKAASGLKFPRRVDDLPRVSDPVSRLAQAWSFAAQRPRMASVYRIAAFHYQESGRCVGFALGDEAELYSMIFIDPDWARVVAREIRTLGAENGNGVPRVPHRLTAPPLSLHEKVRYLCLLLAGKIRWADMCTVQPIYRPSPFAVMLQLGSRREPAPFAVFGIRPPDVEPIAARFERAARAAQELAPGAAMRPILD